MRSFILVHRFENRCFDFVEHAPTEEKPTPFPVHTDLVWVDVTDRDPMPQTGWSANLIDDEWVFADPNASQS